MHTVTSQLLAMGCGQELGQPLCVALTVNIEILKVHVR